MWKIAKKIVENCGRKIADCNPPPPAWGLYHPHFMGQTAHPGTKINTHTMNQKWVLGPLEGQFFSFQDLWPTKKVGF